MFSIASMGWSLTDQSFSPFQDRDHASPQPANITGVSALVRLLAYS